MNEHKTLQRAVNIAAEYFPNAEFKWETSSSILMPVGELATIQILIDPTDSSLMRGKDALVVRQLVGGESIFQQSTDFLQPRWDFIRQWFVAFKRSIQEEVSHIILLCGVTGQLDFPYTPSVHERFDTLTDVMVGDTSFITVVGRPATGKAAWTMRLAYDYTKETGRGVHVLTDDVDAPTYFNKLFNRYPALKSHQPPLSLFPTRAEKLDLLAWLEGLNDIGLIILDSPTLKLTVEETDLIRRWSFDTKAHVVFARQMPKEGTLEEPLPPGDHGFMRSSDKVYILTPDKNNLVPAVTVWKDRDSNEKPTIKAPVHVEGA